MLASLIAGRAAARCARARARIRSWPTPSSRSWARWRPRVRRPEGPFGDHYGYYSLRHDYPVFDVAPSAARRDAIFPATVVGKPRQEDFFIGDLLQELLSPLFPLVMPAVREPLVLRRDRLPLAGRRGREAALRARGHGLGLPHPRRGAAVADQVPARDRPPRGPPGLPGHPRARAGAHAPRDRPLRVLEPVDGHARLHRARGQRRLEGRVARPGRSGARAAARVPRRRRRRPPTSATCASSAAGCLVVGGPPFAADPEAAARFAAHPAFAGWPLVVLTDEPTRAAASAMNFLWTTFTRFEPAADIHAASIARRAPPRPPTRRRS